jgi:hypothetical protein
MSCGTLLQGLNQIIWQIANYKLRHGSLPPIDAINDSIADLLVQSLIAQQSERLSAGGPGRKSCKMLYRSHSTMNARVVS